MSLQPLKAIPRLRLFIILALFVRQPGVGQTWYSIFKHSLYKAKLACFTKQTINNLQTNELAWPISLSVNSSHCVLTAT